MNTQTLSLETANGSTTAYAAVPEGATKAVIVVQEYWGLNDHIKSIADRYADEGFIAIAPDLYRGKIAKDSNEAAQLMQALAIEDGLDIIQKAMALASKNYGVSHFGITGFCMGGTYALRAACEVEGISAAAPFYGDVPDEEILKTLTVPVIFVSATKDKWINGQKVADLEDLTARYELPVTSVKYEADHAFFNNTRPEVYDAEAAKDAWALITGFFNDKL